MFQPIKSYGPSLKETNIIYRNILRRAYHLVLASPRRRPTSSSKARPTSCAVRAADDEERTQLLTWDKCMSVFIGVATYVKILSSSLTHWISIVLYVLLSTCFWQHHCSQTNYKKADSTHGYILPKIYFSESLYCRVYLKYVPLFFKYLNQNKLRIKSPMCKNNPHPMGCLGEIWFTLWQIDGG
jgi:hypothetical protein